jgi:hypothetical protein
MTDWPNKSYRMTATRPLLPVQASPSALPSHFDRALQLLVLFLNSQNGTSHFPVLVLFRTQNPCYYFTFLYDDKDVTISRHLG